MIFNIFSDPHLGLSRKTHTTRDSAQRWTDLLLEYSFAAAGNEHNIMVGDLFDKTHNKEAVVLDGLKLANMCKFTLAGNHDQANRADAKSSLDVVHTALSPGRIVVMQDKFSVSRLEHCKEHGLFLVPHHPTQALFEKALAEAKEKAATGEGFQYLFVHCNRGELPNMTEETLTILDEQEDELLTVFDKIFYGHIHQPSIEKEGRVIQVGNTFPTSFSDTTNKFTWQLNTETNELTKHLLFDATKHCTQLKLGQDIPENPELMFIEVTGKGSRTEIAEYMQRVWGMNPQALAVRQDCQFVENGITIEEVDLSDLHTTITRGLEGTDMLELYNKLRAELCS